MFRKKYISLEFGEHNIKVGLATHIKDEEFEILNSVVVKTPVGVYDNGKLQNMEIAQSVLTEAMKQNRFKGQEAVVYITNKSVYRREYSLPSTNANEIDKLIKREVKQSVPPGFGDYMMQHKTLGTFMEQGITKTQVFAAAVQKTIISEYLDLAIAVGLSPEALNLYSSNEDYIAEDIRTEIPLKANVPPAKQKEIEEPAPVVSNTQIPLQTPAKPIIEEKIDTPIMKTIEPEVTIPVVEPVLDPVFEMPSVTIKHPVLDALIFEETHETPTVPAREPEAPVVEPMIIIEETVSMPIAIPSVAFEEPESESEPELKRTIASPIEEEIPELQPLPIVTPPVETKAIEDAVEALLSMKPEEPMGMATVKIASMDLAPSSSQESGNFVQTNDAHKNEPPVLESMPTVKPQPAYDSQKDFQRMTENRVPLEQESDKSPSTAKNNSGKTSGKKANSLLALGSKKISFGNKGAGGSKPGIKLGGGQGVSKLKDFISIEFGAQNIKLVMANRKGNTLRMQESVLVKMPDESFEDGKLINPDMIRDALKNALRLNNFKSKNAIVSISSTGTISRELILPTTDEAEMDKIVPFEAKQFLPVEAGDYIIQYKWMEAVEERGVAKSKVLVAAMQKVVVETYLELVKSLELKPVSMDLCSNGMAEMFSKDTVINDSNGIQDKTIAVIDMGHKYLVVNIIDNGELKFSRMIEGGGYDLNVIISDVMGIHIHEAELRKIKCQSFMEGHTEDESENLFMDSIRMIIDTWVVKIQRIFMFYESRNRGKRISEVYLYGGSASLCGLAGIMEATLGVPVAQIRTMNTMSLPIDTASMDIKHYMNAIGAIAANR